MKQTRKYLIMLSRPPTTITLTKEDIEAYEQRKLTRDAMRERQMDSSQDTSGSTVEGMDGEGVTEEADMTPAQQTRAARAQKLRLEREARIGIATHSSSRA